MSATAASLNTSELQDIDHCTENPKMNELVLSEGNEHKELEELNEEEMNNENGVADHIISRLDPPKTPGSDWQDMEEQQFEFLSLTADNQQNETMSMHDLSIDETPELSKIFENFEKTSSIMKEHESSKILYILYF